MKLFWCDVHERMHENEPCEEEEDTIDVSDTGTGVVDVVDEGDDSDKPGCLASLLMGLL